MPSAFSIVSFTQKSISALRSCLVAPDFCQDDDNSLGLPPQPPIANPASETRRANRSARDLMSPSRDIAQQCVHIELRRKAPPGEGGARDQLKGQCLWCAAAFARPS